MIYPGGVLAVTSPALGLATWRGNTAVRLTDNVQGLSDNHSKPLGPADLRVVCTRVCRMYT